jgi:hypothetical protein
LSFFARSRRLIFVQNIDKMKSKKNTELIALLGNPLANQQKFEERWMVLWPVPAEIRAAIPRLPHVIYLNRIIAESFERVLRQLITEGLYLEIKEWNGCFNPRRSRGLDSISHHAWGLAIDMNAATNPLFGTVNWSESFLNVWRENGWTCGADFRRRVDGMHFEYNDWTWNDIELYLSAPRS